ncbi:hypothetical protein BC938DRAFT_480367 [Jimgerdemannia flammicorona]|uniref:Uncharacterized protein n=1 Tax=Jimgerdemannia flammicorona TaxID=994334 RepID=A0A433QJ59_9FUNG|nr:hypothetical protein BC938DRAFT_480367 [Jimgerdemannia flammicorona]
MQNLKLDTFFDFVFAIFWLLSDLTGPTYHVHRSYRAVSTQFVCAVSGEEDSACCGWILVYVLGVS